VDPPGAGSGGTRLLVVPSVVLALFARHRSRAYIDPPRRRLCPRRC